MRGFVYRLVPPRPTFAHDQDDAERAAMGAHAQYLAGVCAQGRILAYGPVDGIDGAYGIGILLVDDEEEARAIADGDPAGKAGIGVRIVVEPMLALLTPQGRHPSS